LQPSYAPAGVVRFMLLYSDQPCRKTDLRSASSWCNVSVSGIPQMARRPKSELVVRTSEALAPEASTFLWNHCYRGTGMQ
jgi:hypothetical protein